MQHLEGGAWVTVVQGVPREDGVDYQHVGVQPGEHQYRVVARIGFFAGFPGDPETVIVS